MPVRYFHVQIRTTLFPETWISLSREGRRAWQRCDKLIDEQAEEIACLRIISGPIAPYRVSERSFLELVGKARQRSRRCQLNDLCAAPKMIVHCAIVVMREASVLEGICTSSDCALRAWTRSRPTTEARLFLTRWLSRGSACPGGRATIGAPHRMLPLYSDASSPAKPARKLASRDRIVRGRDYRLREHRRRDPRRQRDENIDCAFYAVIGQQLWCAESVSSWRWLEITICPVWNA